MALSSTPDTPDTPADNHPATYKPQDAPFSADDKVVVSTNSRPYRIATIERTTKLYAIVGDSKFRLRDRRLVGQASAWHFTTIEHLSPGAEQALEREKLVARVTVQRWPNLPLEKLRAIVAILSDMETT